MSIGVGHCGRLLSFDGARLNLRIYSRAFLLFPSQILVRIGLAILQHACNVNVNSRAKLYDFL